MPARPEHPTTRPPHPLPWYVRPAARTWSCAPAPAGVQDFHATLPGHAPTPLVELPSLSDELGVARVFVKDESSRLGLPAFKALGASWAMHRALAGRTAEESGQILAPTPDPITFVTATDGNHGRAVAWTARLFGQRAEVFVPHGVHPAAVAAIAAEGARVIEVDGSYDEAVRRAAHSVRDAEEAGGGPHSILVQDTAWPGYERIPGWIVEGYCTLFAEVDAQLAAEGAGSPGLVAIPVGVGSLAQAAVTHYRAGPAGRHGTALLAVEPQAAACVLESLTQGGSTSITTGATTMAGLNCGTPSALAWPFLRDGLDAAVAVTDAEAARAARDLADLGVSSGPCGAASLAGVRAALTGPGAFDRRTALALTATSTLVLLNTEGTAANPLTTAPGTEG
ncbi:diaminopropionate ammonia-lyase [Streptomyces sp. NPDC058001]|uniref:diaminopropionate ammonia-lyase n=1 Tax=Streptomyces sp. NPDC058001 TaxID=3346300 RepID=UPI0036E0E1FF